MLSPPFAAAILVASAAQWALIAGAFAAVDRIGALPGAAVPPLFLFLSLRSRVFSPLSAARPRKRRSRSTVHWAASTASVDAP